MEQAQESNLHKFWETQPVPQAGNKRRVWWFVEGIGEEGPIDVIKTPAEIRDTPYKLPPSFAWCELDLTNDDEVEFWLKKS